MQAADLTAFWYNLPETYAKECETDLDSLQTEQTEGQRSTEALAKSKKTTSSRAKSLASPIAPLLAVLAVMWLVFVVDWLPFLGIDLTQYGIHPRTLEGLWQIPIAPFIHADLNHLIANSIPLLILGYLIIIRDKKHFGLVFIIAALVSGLGIWAFGGEGTVHMGASGVVFGFMGYLLARSYFERGFVSILFALVALLLYGSILIGVLPGQPGVSWLGHLFGLAGGVLAAFAAHRTRSKPSASSQKATAKTLGETESA